MHCGQISSGSISQIIIDHLSSSFSANHSVRNYLGSLYVTKVKWRCLNSLALIIKRLRRIEYAETLQTSP